jgi:hypothetical protein
MTIYIAALLAAAALQPGSNVVVVTVAGTPTHDGVWLLTKDTDQQWAMRAPAGQGIAYRHADGVSHLTLTWQRADTLASHSWSAPPQAVSQLSGIGHAGLVTERYYGTRPTITVDSTNTQ